MMDADFVDAHRRHWEDAELLRENRHWANADHLYGFSAECGLKALMLKFGMRLKGTMPEERQDKVHADEVWARYESYRSSLGAAKYLLPQENPFSSWNVSDRYARRDNFTESRIAGHRQGADQVRQLIQQAELEGLL